MITIEEAKKIIQSQAFEIRSTIKKLSSVNKNDILSEDIKAPVDLPLFSNSMMDSW